MKSCHSLLFAINLFITTCIGFQTRIEDAVNFCMYRNHYILNSKATCCNMTVIEPGINIQEHWTDCAVAGEGSEDVMKSSWRIYSCILKKVGEGDSITLEKFAELMTKNYEEKFKNPIMEKVTSNSITADYTNTADLNRLRTTYYDIEKEVCSGVVNSEIGKDRDCMNWEEENNRGGRCCGKKSCAIDTDMESYLDLHFPLHPLNKTCETLLNAMKDAGTLLKMTDVMLDNILLICDLSCHLIGEGKIDANTLSSDKVNVEAIADIMYPQWVSKSVKDAGKAYVVQMTNVTEIMSNMEEYQFPNWLNANSPTEKPYGVKSFALNTTMVTESSRGNTKSEIMRRTFPSRLIQFPVTACAVHKQILELVRASLFMNCGDGETTESTS